MDDERILNIIFSKSGCGSPTTKLSIPISWCYDMKLSETNRKVLVKFDSKNKQIIIKNC